MIRAQCRLPKSFSVTPLQTEPLAIMTSITVTFIIFYALSISASVIQQRTSLDNMTSLLSESPTPHDLATIPSTNRTCAVAPTFEACKPLERTCTCGSSGIPYCCDGKDGNVDCTPDGKCGKLNLDCHPGCSTFQRCVNGECRDLGDHLEADTPVPCVCNSCPTGEVCDRGFCRVLCTRTSCQLRKRCLVDCCQVETRACDINERCTGGFCCPMEWSCGRSCCNKDHYCSDRMRGVCCPNGSICN